MALRINKQSKIPTNKCYFHKDKIITSFCCEKQCTLPMCEQCKPIHIEQHQSDNEKNTNKKIPQVINYQQAYLKAYKNLTIQLEEKALERQKYLQFVNHIKKQLQLTLQSSFKSIQAQIRQKYHFLSNLENVINKMERGSLKTLIFYYAGDLYSKHNIQIPNDIKQVQKNLDNMNKKLQQFQSMLKVWDINKNMQDISININKRLSEETNNQNSQKVSSYSNLGLYSKNINQQSVRKQSNRFNYLQQNYQTFNNTKKQSNHQNYAIPTVSIYGKKQQYKQLPSKNHIERQNNHHHYQNSTIQNKNIDKQNMRNDSVKEIRQKYLKNQHSIGNLLQENNQNVGKREIMTNYHIQKQRSYSGLGYGHKSYQLKKVQPLNLRQRQYHQQDKPITFERKIQKDNNINNHINIQQQYDFRPLKPSDLEVNNSTQKFNKYSQRVTRSITEMHQQPDNTCKQRLSLNKEVLSPDQIRKMLEQRMAQRSRILASRKSTTPNKFQQKKKTSKTLENYNRNTYGTIQQQRPILQHRTETYENQRWETKDSIINQIYQTSQEHF